MPDTRFPPVSETWHEPDQRREGAAIVCWSLVAVLFWGVVLGGVAWAWLT